MSQFFCNHCQDTGKEPLQKDGAPVISILTDLPISSDTWCSTCAGFTRKDFQDFCTDIAEEMVKLGKSEAEAKALVAERFIPRGPGSLLFHDPPDHWAKLVVLGPGYWRKKQDGD